MEERHGSGQSSLASPLSVVSSPTAEAARDAAKEKEAAEWQAYKNLAAFWLLGLLNNSAYVIMNAGATEISSGAIGLVYFCGVFPSLLVKSTGPYWFHYLSYGTRSWLIAALMSMSYIMVAFGGSLTPQLFGVVLSSLQGGLGESSCLAMSTFYDSNRAINCWSSGTGFAGVFGYFWVASLHLLLGLSFRSTLLLANVSSLGWLAVYYYLLQPPDVLAASALARTSSDLAETGVAIEAVSSSEGLFQLREGEEGESDLLRPKPGRGEEEGLKPADLVKLSRTKHMSWRERLRRTCALWPYMVPLTVVFFSEYSMQAGTWTAIGFPVIDPAARKAFYTYSNWMYQIGVFISRSSGMLYQADRTVLWLMPLLQAGFLLFFTLDAWLQFWYNYWLLVPSLITGLLGGAVYVNAFTLLSREVEPEFREFSLSAASLGDSLGIATADIFGILIQGCLFKINKLPGASFTC